MPSYVRSRLLAAREFVVDELNLLKASDPVYDPAVIEAFRSIIPFDNYLFSGVDLEGCYAGSAMVLSTDMPLVIFRDYHRQGLIQADPVFNLATPEHPDLFDIRFELTPGADVKTRKLAEIEGLHLLAPRTVFTFWNRSGRLYGLAAFTRDTPFTPAERTVLKWFGTRHHNDLQLPILRGFNQQLNIRDKEKACLDLASRGLSSEAIADELALSVESVNSYFRSATKKLGARNRSQLIADALRLGLIE